MLIGGPPRTAVCLLEGCDLWRDGGGGGGGGRGGCPVWRGTSPAGSGHAHVAPGSSPPSADGGAAVHPGGL